MRVHRLFLTIVLTILAAANAHAQTPPQWPLKLVEDLCASGIEVAAKTEKILGRAPSGLKALKTHLNKPKFFAASGTLTNSDRLDVNVRFIGRPNKQVRLSYFAGAGAGKPAIPLLLIDLAADCSLNRAVFLSYKTDGRLDKLQHYSKNLQASDRTEVLNPPVPPGTDPGGVAVAHFDTGVNYLLPLIANRLARDASGNILGYDFKDNDRQPFDLDPTFPAFLPRRHGTAVISILLREAPDARIIPYRYPGRDIARFADMVDAVSAGPARIVAMPLGGYKRDQWQSFAAAARAHPEILFVISAGNDGRDIDEKPIFPASLPLDNFLVVTSTDAFGQLPIESNWGTQAVDISTPAEHLNVIDHRGARGKASGSSYAVPRIAALAARLSKRHPEWTALDIKHAITKLAGPRPKGKKITKFGWIALPDQEGF